MRRLTTIALVAALFIAGCSSGGGGDPPAQVTAPPSGGPAPAPASALFVLGDSLSDVGNAAAVTDYLLSVVVDPPTVGLCNPTDILISLRRCDDLFYRQSRVSDGPVAVEHVAAYLGLGGLEPSLQMLPSRPVEGTVYAVASAKARGQDDEDLARQVDWLLLDRTPLPADAVYVVMIGGNDAIDALQADVADFEAAPRPSAAVVTAAVTAIGASVERLLAFGARRIVVANVPDLATLPAVRIEAQAHADEAAVLAAASAISAAFDRELDATLDDIEVSTPWPAPTPLAITRFDLRAALRTVQQSVDAAGGNALDACFDSDRYHNSSAAERIFHADCAPPAPDGSPRFAEFVFWDGIHPTGATHAALGAALSELLRP